MIEPPHQGECRLLRDGKTCNCRDDRDDGYAMTAKPSTSTALWVLTEARKERDEALNRVAELEAVLRRFADAADQGDDAHLGEGHYVPHDCTTHDPGCFRCQLSRDEVEDDTENDR